VYEGDILTSVDSMPVRGLVNTCLCVCVCASVCVCMYVFVCANNY